MKYSAITLVLFVTLSGAAAAQGDSWREQIERADSASMPTNVARDYVRNANDCAPSQSRAVWGPNQSLLGYACYERSTN